MNPAFTSAFMAGYLPLMQRIIADRTAEWLKRATIDLMVEAREITFDVAAAALVGLRSGPQVDWLRERFYVLLRGTDPRMNENWEQLIQRQLQARDDLAEQTAAAHRRAALGARGRPRRRARHARARA